MMAIPRIPERELALARHLGLRETDIQGSWNRYAKWTVERFGEAALLGGEPWTKWAREDAINLAKNREGVDEAKDRARREAEAYKREATTFDGWIAGLARKKARGVVLATHEARVLAWYERHPEPKPRGALAMLAFWGDQARGAEHGEPRVRVTDEVASERRAQSLRDLQHSDLLEGLGLEAGGAT